MSTYADQAAADQQRYTAIQIDQGIRQQGADCLASLFDGTHDGDTTTAIAQAMAEGYEARVIRDAQREAAMAGTADPDGDELLRQLFGAQTHA